MGASLFEYCLPGGAQEAAGCSVRIRFVIRSICHSLFLHVFSMLHTKITSQPSLYIQVLNVFCLLPFFLSFPQF